ncbi:isoprenylcysteine carboxylmethyltransferase family protein [Pseudomonas cavernae]|uniref:Isoprenylcysteine carboxylmethyltransferase family protein n=1 Tax=Pseudomonas cavernae TaxID=2320867 RepID=A0A385Z771_9PSED|nr:isoprenylcysteine carboxylmethyltransferase family protein [Pseudomonas cavernae]AYC34360.1 isoprenylcysteine carboxylmethyltransferase family protein [Pseudomonas cavernae]
MSTREGRIILAPPLIYLIFIALVWALSALLPLPLGENVWTRYLGWGLIDAGILLAAWSALALAQHKTTINPYKKPKRLLASGPFRYSRNPIYLGFNLIYCGIGLLLHSWWPWIALPLLILTMNRGVIVHEEQILEQLFGDSYRRYRRRVRRWL